MLESLFLCLPQLGQYSIYFIAVDREVASPVKAIYKVRARVRTDSGLLSQVRWTHRML